MLNALNPDENGGNHDVKQHISFSMSAETNKSLDIAFNLNYEGIYNQEQMNKILNYYNQSRHETLTQTLFNFPYFNNFSFNSKFS